MIVPDDVAAWFYTQVNVTAVTSAVTGGVWNGRPLETASAPYGVFLVSRQADTEYTSAGELPKFDVKLAVSVDQNAATKAQGVEQMFGPTVLPLAPTGLTAMVRSGAGTVIGCTPRDCSADVQFPLRAKSDVVGVRLAWEVWVQAASTGV